MIIELQVENYLRIKAVNIKADGSLMVISGKNGQGKTSILRAFEWLLGGKKAEPEDLIHHGADRARVALQINDEFLIEKIQKKGKPTQFKVTSPDGEKLYKTPMKLLSAFRNVIGFDPLEFLRMKPKERNEIFRKILGLDFTDLDLRYDKLYADRTERNRTVESLEHQLDQMPKANDDLPEKAISIAQLIELRDATQDAIADNVKLSHNFATAQEAVKRCEEALAEAKEQYENMQMISPVVIKHDMKELTHQIDNAPSINEQIKRSDERMQKIAEFRDAERAIEKLTHEIEKIRSDKRLAVEAAEMPISGLGYGEDGLIYNGVPIEQASQSEQLILSTAIGLMLNPLGIILIREGSLLDDSRLKLLEEFVESKGGLVILEKVTNGEEGVGFVIEDGLLAYADAAA